MTDDAENCDSSASDEPIDAKMVDASGHPPMTDRQTYNVISDTVAGVNLRLTDNVLQAIVIAICVVLGVFIGALAVEEHLPGALAGGFVGLILGFFGSGTFLMIYRAMRHIRGKHD